MQRTYGYCARYNRFVKQRLGSVREITGKRREKVIVKLPESKKTPGVFI